MITLAYYDEIEKDELFYGWLLRLAVHNGYRVSSNTVECFISDFFCGGERKTILKKMGKDFPYGLDNIVEQMEPALRINQRDIVLEHTAFPVMCHSYELGRQALFSQMLLRDRNHVINKTAKRQFTIDSLRYCPLCMRENIDTGKEPFFRTWHNLPGVQVCWKHKVKLKTYKYEQLSISAEKTENLAHICYAKLVYICFKHPMLTSLSETQKIIKDELDRLGWQLEHLFSILIRSGFEGVVSSEKELTRVLRCKKVAFEKIFAVLTVIEQANREMHKKLLQNRLVESMPMNNDFEALTAPDLLVKYRNTYGEFWAHPYALFLGIGNPNEESHLSNHEIINRQLKCIDNGEYIAAQTIKGYDETSVILHCKCNKLLNTRVTNFIWDGNRCKCSYCVTAEKIQEVVDNEMHEYEIVGCTSTKAGIVIRVLHKREFGGCGMSFSIKKENFTGNIYCRKCRTKSEIISRIGGTLGDQYEITAATTWKSKIAVKHLACGTQSMGYPREFLNGRRCTLCSFGIKDHGIRSAGALFREISTWCLTHKIWIMNRKQLCGIEKIEEQLVYLCNKKYIYRVDIGVYSIHPSVSVEEYVNEKYLLDETDKHCGVYDAESALFIAGIIEEQPKTIHIMSGSTNSKSIYSSYYNGCQIRVKPSYVEMTDLNYKAIFGLNLIHTLSRNYTLYQKVKEYLKCNQFDFRLMKAYAGAYPRKTAGIFERMNKEIHSGF